MNYDTSTLSHLDTGANTEPPQLSAYDVQELVNSVKEVIVSSSRYNTKVRFPLIVECWYSKGFHSSSNPCIIISLLSFFLSFFFFMSLFFFFFFFLSLVNLLTVFFYEV